MKVTNFGTDGLPQPLSAWSTGVVSYASNALFTATSSNTRAVNGVVITGAAASNYHIVASGSNFASWVPHAAGGGSALTVLDEGTPLATDASALDFVGSGVVASGAGSTKTITIGSATLDVGIPIIIGDGANAIATGSKGFLEIPFGCTILAAHLAANVSGSVVIDVKKATYAGLFTTASICAAAKPTLSTAQKSQDTTLTGWTTTIAAGDWLEINLDSVTTITRVTLSLTVRRT